MATFVALRHLVTTLVTGFTYPDNLTSTRCDANALPTLPLGFGPTHVFFILAPNTFHFKSFLIVLVLRQTQKCAENSHF